MVKKIPSAKSILKSKISNSQSLRVLIVEDSEDDTLLIIRELKKGGYNPVQERVETASAMKKALKEKQWDIILCDYKLPKFNAPSAIALLKESNIDIPLIIVSGTIGEETAVECMRLGAQDYIMKNNLSRLCPAIARELKEAETRNKQKQAKEALRESEAQFRSLFENSLMGISAATPNGHLIHANLAYAQMYGYDNPAQMIAEITDIGHTLYANPEDRKEVLRILTKKGFMEPRELEVVKRDGTRFFVLVSAREIRDNGGKLLYYQATHLDITERKQAEKTIIHSEKRFKTLYQESPIPTFTWQKKEDDFFLVDCNRAAMQLTAGKANSYRGKSAQELYRKRTEIIEDMLRCFKEQSTMSRELVSQDFAPERFLSVHYSYVPPDLIIVHAQDIHQRKQAEEALRESEDRYRALFDRSLDLVYLCDFEGRFIDANDAALNKLGYRREEISSLNFASLLSEDQLSAAFEITQEIKETGIQKIPREFKLRHKDGSEIYVETQGSAVISNGMPVAVQSIAREITERKQAEKELRQSEERYRTILENIEEAYFEDDLSGNFTFVNDALCKHLGYSREELIGKNNKLYTDEKNASKLRELYEHLYKTGEPIKAFDLEAINKNGSKMIYETSAFLMRNPKGEPIGFRGVSRDVTQRKQMEDALQQSEERYRTIIDTIQDGYIETDITGKLTFINDMITKHLGYSREELIGKNSNVFQDEVNYKKTIQFFTEIYKTGKSINAIELECIRKDGTKGIYELALSMVKDAQEKPIGFRSISRDITERKKAEEVLRASEEKYRTIIETIQDGYLEMDLNGRYTFMNDVIGEHLEYSREELIGATANKFQDEENYKKTRQQFAETYKTGKPVKALELECIRKDGSKGIYELSLSLMKDAKGKPIGFRSISRDITERKLLEEKIRQSEKKYRTILEEMEEAYFEVDLAGNFTFVNDAECSHLGYSREELIGMNNRQYTDEENAKKVYQAFSQIYETREPRKLFDYEIIKKDGTREVSELLASLIRDTSGKPIGFRGLARLITERKKMEEILRQSEEKYRNIIENMQEGYFEMDIAGNLTFVNDAECRNLGYPKEELIGMNNRQYQNETTAQKMYQLFNRLYRTGEPVKALDVEIIRKNGTKSFNEISVSLIRNAEGKPIGFRGISRDITERKQAEEERKQSFERMRKALRATVQAISMTVEMKDPYTSGHQQRVSDLARSIATEMGLSADRRDFIRTASTIHDIGKVSIPSEILSKPTKLTDLEFSLIKTHSQSGYNILKDIEFPWPVADVVLQHHERMDGSGYPQGLKGEQTLLESRIIAIADVVEAIASHRPYRPALGIEAALGEIEKNKGILYDNTVADACLRLFREKSYHFP